MKYGVFFPKKIRAPPVESADLKNKSENYYKSADLKNKFEKKTNFSCKSSQNVKFSKI